MQRGVQAKVKRVICRITINDRVLARQRYLPAGIAYLKKSARGGQSVEVQTIGSGPLRLEGGTRRRKQSLAARDRIWNIQLRVQRVNRRIFEHGLDGKVGKEAHSRVDPQSFVRTRLQQSLLRGLIFTGGVGGLRKGGERLGVLVFLAKYVG